MTNNTNLINQYSGDVEYYTPQPIVDTAREVMGGIDLDPASSEFANTNIIHAKTIFTKFNDGLNQDWFGKLWLNWPFSKGEKACAENCKKKRCKPILTKDKDQPDYFDHKKIPNWRGHCISVDVPSNGDWIEKLVSEYDHRRIECATVISYASTSEKWFKPLLRFPISFISPRVSYMQMELVDCEIECVGGEKIRVGGHMELVEKKGAGKGSCIIYLGQQETEFTHRFNGRLADSQYVGSVFYPMGRYQ